MKGWRRAIQPIRKDLKYALIFVLVSLLASAIIDIVWHYPVLKGLRAFLGAAYVLFLPGYVVVRCFFKEVDAIEKAALSFGLSIALVILSVMFSNLLFQIPITTLTNFLVLLAVIIIVLAIKHYEKPIQKFFSQLNKKIKRALPIPLRKLFY